MTTKQINSHIALTKKQLEYFSFREGSFVNVYSLNLISNEIKKEKIKYANTQEGYYHNSTESRMNREVEDKFHKLIKKITKNLNTDDQVKLFKNDIDVIKKFLNLSLYRNKTNIDLINEESITSKILGNVDHDFIIDMFLNGHYGDLYEGLTPLLLLNKTDNDLVITSSSLYGAGPYYKNGDKNRFTIIFPISPKIAFYLVDDIDLNYLKISTFYPLMTLEKNEMVSLYNRYALYYENQNTNIRTIYSRSHETLIELKNKNATL